MNTTIEKIQVLPDFKKVQILELITHPDLIKQGIFNEEVKIKFGTASITKDLFIREK